MTLDGHEDWVRTANFSPDGAGLGAHSSTQSSAMQRSGDQRCFFRHAHCLRLL